MGNKKKEVDPVHFEGFMTNVIEITCTKCGFEDVEHNSEEWYAAQDFYDRGWRVTRENCYCPKCTEKYKIKGL